MTNDIERTRSELLLLTFICYFYRVETSRISLFFGKNTLFNESDPRYADTIIAYTWNHDIFNFLFFFSYNWKESRKS